MAEEKVVAEANALFVDENYDDALQKFTEAINQNQVSDYYVKRSICYYKLNNFTNALSDAEKAIELDQNNGKAYLRKGQAAFSLEKYDVAKQAFEKSQELSPNNQTKTWIRKCEAELVTTPSDKHNETKQTPTPTAAPTPTPTPTPTPQTTSAPSKPPAPKYRHEWFQTETHVDICVFAKNLSNDQVTVNIQEKHLEVTIKLPNENSEFQLNFDLAGTIVPAESKWTLSSIKIEIKLKKSNVSKWPTLEDTGAKVKSWDTVIDGKPSGLSYPSSSKHGQKNWDKLVKEQAEEKLDGDAALNKVFQDIYSGASDEQRRAMMKSFQESGGTVLSTNWDEVGKGMVKGSPPKGMEMKDWKDIQN